MDDDATPRLAPPPKPSILQLSTPKPVVPEVSLMFDSDDSLIWKGPKTNILHEGKPSPRNHAQQDSGQLINQNGDTQEVANILRKNCNSNSSTRNALGRNVQFEPSLKYVQNKGTYDMVSKALSYERRLQDSQVNQPQYVTTSPSISPSVTASMKQRPYDPQIYSPAHKMTVKKTSSDGKYHGLNERESSLTGNVISFAQKYTPQVVESLISPHARSMQSVVSTNVNGGPGTPPLLNRVVQSHGTASHPSVGTESSTPRKTDLYFRNSNLSQKQNNKETISPLAPALQQPRYPTNGLDFAQDKIVRVNRDYFSTAPTSLSLQTSQSSLPLQASQPSLPLHASQPSLPLQASQPSLPLQASQPSLPLQASQPSLPLQVSQPNYAHQHKRSNITVNPGWPYPEPLSYSPLAVNGGIHTATDPVVYHLIEDQNKQILKLTKALDTLLEKQQENESVRGVRTSEATGDKVLYPTGSTVNQDNGCREISTQTLVTDKPETRSTGVNTDLSWSDLLASIRESNMCEVLDRLDPSYDRFSQEIQSKPVNRDSPKGSVIPNNYQSRQKKGFDRRKSASLRNISESTDQEDKSITEQGGIPVRLEEDARSHSPIPVSVLQYHDDSDPEESSGCLRNDDKESVEYRDPLTMGESPSAQQNNVWNQNQSPSLSPHPPGVSFYNNVMTNINQILQNAKAAEQVQQNEINDNDQTSQPVAVDAGSPDVLLDPHIEAVKKQLMQFGISFMDPASLTTNHKAVMDTMYVPGFHNMLSMYQSTISTHYLESDAMAAKYLTDSQLAAIAAMSPAMKKRNEGEGTRKINDSTGPVEVIGSQERMQSQLYKFTVNNNFSLATKKFLERYGLHDD